MTPQGFPGVCWDSNQVLELFLLDQSFGERVSSPALCSSLAFGISHACVLGAVVRWLRVQISFRCENAKRPGREEQSRCPLSASWGSPSPKSSSPTPGGPSCPMQVSVLRLIRTWLGSRQSPRGAPLPNRPQEGSASELPIAGQAGPQPAGPQMPCNPHLSGVRE